MNFLETVSICKQDKRFMRINKVITKRAVRCGKESGTDWVSYLRESVNDCFTAL